MALAATSDDPDEYRALYFYDLGALRELPAEIVGLDRLENLSLNIGPDGQRHYVFRRDISDISCLSGLTELTSLDLSRTPVADIAVLSGLTGLTSLNLTHTGVADLSVMRELPVFEAEKAQLLQYDDTPAIITDSRLDLLSRLPPKRCAVETVQYLKGTHPDFRAPSNVAAPAPLAQRLAEASPVGLEIVDGALEATNPGAPERVAPRELAQRVDALRTHVAMLIDEARARQVPDSVRVRFERYLQPLQQDEPTYLLLDGPMAFLRGGLGDTYTTDALDGGFVEGWRAMVVMHDDLRPLLLPPEEDTPDLPELTPEATADEGERIADEAIGVLEGNAAVGESVVAAMKAAKEYFEVAKMDATRRPGMLARGYRAIGGIVGLIVGGVGLIASVMTIQLWAATPQGQAVIVQLQPIFERIIQLFGGG